MSPVGKQNFQTFLFDCHIRAEEVQTKLKSEALAAITWWQKAQSFGWCQGCRMQE